MKTNSLFKKLIIAALLSKLAISYADSRTSTFPDEIDLENMNTQILEQVKQMMENNNAQIKHYLKNRQKEKERFEKDLNDQLVTALNKASIEKADKEKLLQQIKIETDHILKMSEESYQSKIKQVHMQLTKQYQEELKKEKQEGAQAAQIKVNNELKKQRVQIEKKMQQEEKIAIKQAIAKKLAEVIPSLEKAHQDELNQAIKRAFREQSWILDYSFGNSPDGEECQVSKKRNDKGVFYLIEREGHENKYVFVSKDQENEDYPSLIKNLSQGDLNQERLVINYRDYSGYKGISKIIYQHIYANSSDFFECNMLFARTFENGSLTK